MDYNLYYNQSKGNTDSIFSKIDKGPKTNKNITKKQLKLYILDK